MTNGNSHIDPQIEEIERYLTGALSENESVAFEKKLEEDHVLKDKVEDLRLVLLGIAEAGLQQQMETFHRQRHHTVQEKKMVRAIGTRWMLAASLALLLALTTWWYFRYADVNNRRYAAWYRPDPGLMTVMSGESNHYLFDKAMVAYKNADYKSALKQWDDLLKTQPDNDTLLYFTASAMQALSDYTHAAPRYISVLVSDSSIFKSDAAWYLGLIFMRRDDMSKARFYFALSNRPEARRLLQELGAP